MGTTLQGLLVLDLTRVLAGPYCTMVLADLGARVIKIEMPGSGDDSRAYGPFVNGESMYFASLNRNKESVVIDLKSDEGRQVFRRLAGLADVLVENYRPQTMANLGLDYPRLREVNPKLIYAACSGFGQTGPYRDKPAYDVIIQGMGGIMSLTGYPGGEPTRVGASIGDITAGLFTAVGILSALEQRHRTGLGQFVDISMLDCQVAILENAIARFHASREVPTAIGNRHPSITPFTSVRASNGHLVVAAGNDTLWRRLCQSIDRPALASDPRFVTNDLRTRHAEELGRILDEAFGARERDEWLKILEEAGVPAGPINTVADVVADPHVGSRQMIVEVDHPVAGSVKFAGSPVKFSEDGSHEYSPSPILGQHTRSVLHGLLGLTEEEIGRLVQSRAVERARS